MARQGNKFITFIILYVLSGVYFFVFSESGLLERTSLKKKNLEIIQKNEHLRKENKKLLASYTDLKKNNHIEKLLLDTGYAYRNNKILVLKDFRNYSEKHEPREIQKTFQIEASHLRIIWLIVSILILLFYYSRKIKTNET